MSRFWRNTLGSPPNSRLSSSSRSSNGSRTADRKVARVASKYALELSRSRPSNHATASLPKPANGTGRGYAQYHARRGGGDQFPAGRDLLDGSRQEVRDGPERHRADGLRAR